MNWGNWIVVAFVLFAGFIATLVTICVKQDISLVSKSYYKEEGAYQARLVAANNASSLQHKPVIRMSSGYLLSVKYDQLNAIEKGEIVVFSPSTESRDRRFVLQHSADSIQMFDLSTIARGMYRAKLSWTMDGREYYMEEIIHR